MWRQHSFRLLLCAFLIGLSTIPADTQSNAYRPPSGSYLQFIVDTNTANDILIGNVGDLVMFTGRPGPLVSVGDCPIPPAPCCAGPFPQRYQQDATIVDPEGGRAARTSFIVVTYYEGADFEEPIPPAAPGTRVGSLTSLGSCNSATYVKLRGVVE